MRIHHRDLHSGNIMINENGEPIIIDFGDATTVYLSSDDPYRETRAGRNIVYGSDLQKINTIRTELGDYLKNKGFFQQKGETI